jgi:hypothetical protein
MKVSGFTFIRNALTYDYPIREAILSIAPLCDEIVVAVGHCDDGTRALVAGTHEKVRIVDTVWDDSKREGGAVLAEETNKALDAIAADADWAFYIQGDEVFHERDVQAVRRAMEQWKDDRRVEGLLFDYVHFYGSYDYVGDSPRWYRREIRIVRPGVGVRSWGDAQGFRKNGQKLRVKPSGGHIHHYGWVKHPRHQQLKQQSFNKLWHDDRWMQEHVPDVAEFDYSQVESVVLFAGAHPQVMQERIARMNWKFSFDPTRKRIPFKYRLKLWVERITGWRPGEYRNYRKV